LRLIDKTPFLKECKSCIFRRKGEARKDKIQTVKPKILHSTPGEEKPKVLKREA
jgi:hypothetical protein